MSLELFLSREISNSRDKYFNIYLVMLIVNQRFKIRLTSSHNSLIIEIKAGVKHVDILRK